MRKKAYYTILTMIFVCFLVGANGQEYRTYYEQMMVGNLEGASYYPPDDLRGPSSPYQVTDNFIVPEGDNWELTEVEIYGLASSILSSFDLFIYYSEPAPADDFSFPFPGEVYASQQYLNFHVVQGYPALYQIFLNSPIIIPCGKIRAPERPAIR